MHLFYFQLNFKLLLRIYLKVSVFSIISRLENLISRPFSKDFYLIGLVVTGTTAEVLGSVPGPGKLLCFITRLFSLPDTESGCVPFDGNKKSKGN